MSFVLYNNNSTAVGIYTKILLSASEQYLQSNLM